MRSGPALGVVALVLCACGTSSARSEATTAASTTGTTASGAPCGPAHARTLAHSGEARVYESGSSVFGCSTHSSRQFRLASRVLRLGGARIGVVAVSGVRVAYALQRSGVDTGSAEVLERRLTDGRTLFQHAATTTPQRAESFVLVPALVLTRSGAMAWLTAATSLVAHANTVEVHASDRHGLRLLDSGSTISTRELSVNNSVVHWRHGGQARSARLY